VSRSEPDLDRLAITQPYVPEYRVPLFENLRKALNAEGVELRVFFGLTREDEEVVRSRGNSAVPDWAERVRLRTLRVPRGPLLRYRELPTGWDKALLLTEMQAANGNAWTARVGNRPFLTIGHGKGYTSRESRLSVSLETWLNRGARHVLTYMPSGRAEVVRRTGMDPDSVSTFYNSTDTRRLRAALDDQTAGTIAAFRAQHGLPDNAQVALYVGALTEYKRIDLLTAAARIVLRNNPLAWLVVAGDGPEMAAVKKLTSSSGRVIALGHSGPVTFAAAAKLARLVVNPGRVGLVAVDALAMKLPVLTTQGAPDAPEIEYLVEEESVFHSSPTAEGLAHKWQEILGKPLPDVAPEIPSVERSALLIAEAVISVRRRG
jgi:glycosyltransferase involved in cell wall biosynthesis